MRGKKRTKVGPRSTKKQNSPSLCKNIHPNRQFVRSEKSIRPSSVYKGTIFLINRPVRIWPPFRYRTASFAASGLSFVSAELFIYSFSSDIQYFRYHWRNFFPDQSEILPHYSYQAQIIIRLHHILQQQDQAIYHR